MVVVVRWFLVRIRPIRNENEYARALRIAIQHTHTEKQLRKIESIQVLACARACSPLKSNLIKTSCALAWLAAAAAASHQYQPSQQPSGDI